MAQVRTHFRTCHLCEAMCGIVIEVEDERILSIRGDKDDPFSRGHICPKAVALKDVHEDPDRLRRPLRRTATGWAEVSWDEALEEAAERLSAIQKAHGRNAVAIYNGNPVAHNHGSLIFGQILGGPAPADADVAPDVRTSAPAADPRHRPHRLPAHPRREPARLQRQPHDRARGGEAAQGGPRPRRARRGGGPAADGDRGPRRPAPGHPPGGRRVPAGGNGCTSCSRRSACGRASWPRSPTACT